jgi:tRNA A-37 threonylcarbamoyl transferase component Bud32/tetratricopeptide (TPR) repeat protein
VTVRYAIEHDCPGEDDIAAFLRGGLARWRARWLEAHLARCSPCRRLLSALAQASAESRSASDSVSPTLPLDSSTSEVNLQAGARFGRYVVLDWLGAGGMGVVYSAYDPELSRKVALKVLGLDDAGVDRPALRDLLLREAQAMAQLAHPNVVTVFDVGTFDDRVFIAMELVDGMTLAKWLIAERRTRGEIIAVLLAAGHGLAAAHAAGLIHRDFKPDNVLIGKDGRVRVTDFGLARWAPAQQLAAQDGTVEPGSAGTTQTGLAGTLAYMAPEQYAGRSVDARADQFSFAVSLYEALHGERPFDPLRRFDGDRAAERIASTASRRGVPAALRRMLLRALSPDPGDRYPSMAELLAVLAPRPRRARVVAVGATVLVVAALATAGGYALHLRRVAEQRIELAGQLRGLAPEMRMTLRNAHMLPRHDIRAARGKVRSDLLEVERALHTAAGQEELALIQFVLGEGHRALGDHERAMPLLESAWQAGKRGADIEAALGHTLGLVFWRQLEHIERTVPASRSEAQIHSIEKRYREPAMAHLKAALAAGAGSRLYLEALMAYYERRFPDATRLAGAAFAEAPTFYEAGMLEARARHAAARELLAADRTDEAIAGFALARQVYERVLEIARSDDQAWLDFGDMVHAQAVALALAQGELPPTLRQKTIGALHTARQINPDRWEVLLREAEIYEHDANVAIVGYRDPSPHVDKALVLADAARVVGADVDQVDVLVCVLHWERAVYQSTHGVDPRPAFGNAVVACERSLAAKPDANKHASLGTVYDSLAAYEGDHGGDPMRYAELSDRHLRAAISIDEDAGLHYSIGRLWARVAHYQVNHGKDPQRAVDTALAGLGTTVWMDARRGDAWAAMSDALIARVRFQQAAQQDTQDAVTRAHMAIERALAIEPELLPPIKYRILLAELDAESRLARDADPTQAVSGMRTNVQLLLQRLPDDDFTHRAWCRAELLAVRWALSRRQPVGRLLARATAEATRAREIDPLDADGWTASAEVELLRAEATRARGSLAGMAINHGLELIERALEIDPKLSRALRVRDALARQADLVASRDHESTSR